MELREKKIQKKHLYDLFSSFLKKNTKIKVHHILYVSNFKLINYLCVEWLVLCEYSYAESPTRMNCDGVMEFVLKVLFI